jgi:hypothetical protein
MIIKTRQSVLTALDIPTSWERRLQYNPNDRIYITTEKPASECSIEELQELILMKETNQIIKDATIQLYEALDILKKYGAEIDLDIIGIQRPD